MQPSPGTETHEGHEGIGGADCSVIASHSCNSCDSWLELSSQTANDFMRAPVRSGRWRVHAVRNRSRSIRGVSEKLDPTVPVDDHTRRGDRQPMLPLASKDRRALVKPFSQPNMPRVVVAQRTERDRRQPVLACLKTKIRSIQVKPERQGQIAAANHGARPAAARRAWRPWPAGPDHRSAFARDRRPNRSVQRRISLRAHRHESHRQRHKPPPRRSDRTKSRPP